MTAPHPTTPPVLRITKLLPGTPEEVFAAWTDPESLQAWMCPESRTVPAVTLDLRVGGKFQIVMRSENSDIVHVGEYREITPPQRLVFTWQSPATLQQETLVTIELFSRGEHTELILIHEMLPNDRSSEQHKQGWQGIVERLGRFLGT